MASWANLGSGTPLSRWFRESTISGRRVRTGTLAMPWTML